MAVREPRPLADDGREVHQNLPAAAGGNGGGEKDGGTLLAGEPVLHGFTNLNIVVVVVVVFHSFPAFF